MIRGVRESGTVWNESFQASWGREPWTMCHLGTILYLLFPFSLIPGGQGGAILFFFFPEQETKIQDQERMKTRPPRSPPQSSDRGEGG